jgi:hypothetical protein
MATAYTAELMQRRACNFPGVGSVSVVRAGNSNGGSRCEAATDRSQATISVQPVTDDQPAVPDFHQFDIALPISPWQHTSTLFKQA